MAATRTYDMTRRARAAAETTERIVAATEALLGSAPIGDVTLQDIAAGAGVTVQTVLRHMGSREGCFAAVGERIRTRVEAQRGHTVPGDVDAAIASLVDHYEAEGRLVLNLLAQEGGSDPIPRQAAEAGRAYHRAWVRRSFGPWEAEPEPELLDALVAATDLYVWKLLRLDLGRTVATTEAVIARLVRATLEVPCRRS
jgi:AcrR family transcriptional regulator